MEKIVTRFINALLILGVLGGGFCLLWMGANIEESGTRYAFYGGFVVYCIGFGLASYRYLNEAIYKFVNPEADETHQVRILKTEPDNETNRIAGFVAKLLLTGAALILVLFLADIWIHFKIPPVTADIAWAGPFGDFFGGVLNPILTFISFIALAFSFTLQRVQVRDAREQAIESKKVSRQQMFETTFFNLLTLHNSSAEQLHLEPDTIRYPGVKWDPDLDEVDTVERGRAVFGAVLDIMRKQSRTRYTPSHLPEPPIASTPPIPAQIYIYIQHRHNFVLGHYFRNLFQILSYIDEFAVDDPFKAGKKSPRRRYANLLRAQLSTNELTLLYFNCQGTLVDNGRFRELVTRYRFLEHLPVSLDQKTGKPCVDGYGFEIDISEYIDIFSGGLVRPGAFGTNPQIQRYLEKFQQTLVTVPPKHYVGPF
ncbi:putative phage abortive infection protein [Herbaspirillum robiniae]|uniref:Uncharacterized protein n=1 Tax=Herbaspirillum robiniae TaxID=2014887 RepID=A0ABX2M177_9BURK|nr:putative phage abortive infection protein [Herbaspirillum robiniae]NUU04131.1 hypothetical protein [Herbaspirillum robiniae]